MVDVGRKGEGGGENGGLEESMGWCGGYGGGMKLVESMERGCGEVGEGDGGKGEVGLKESDELVEE